MEHHDAVITGPRGMRTAQTPMKRGNTCLVGDAEGWGGVFCGLVYSDTKTGKTAVKDICGLDISEELRQFVGNTPPYYNTTVPVRIRGKINRFVINSLLPKLAKDDFIINFVFPLVYTTPPKTAFDPLLEDEELTNKDYCEEKI